jgi:L,D-transpeptidase ErfK/SrfK
LLLVLSVSGCAGSLVTGTQTPAPAEEFTLAPGQTAVGEVKHYTVQKGDVFADIARRFDLGYTELAAANPGVDPWVPPPGTVLTIPAMHVLPEAPRKGIVVNLAQSRLYYFAPGGGRVETHPITIGFIGKNTPLGTTKVVRKEPNPTWYPPASIRREEPGLPAAVPPGPDNPLGAFALRLGWNNYLIHGTNKPDSIGRTVSHGCIRLYPEDIARLFGEVGVGTTVRTVQQPATAGWQGEALYVQVAPSKTQAEQIDTEKPVKPDPAHGITKIVRAAAGEYARLVDWAAVERAAKERSGMPVAVARRSGYASPARPAEGGREAENIAPGGSGRL